MYTSGSRPTDGAAGKRILRDLGNSWEPGLRLLVSKPVDAVILEYHLGLLDGAAVADEIKKIRPRLPIVMLAESLELPEGALKSVDALVTNCDGPRFLLEAIHTVLQAKDRMHFDSALQSRLRR